MTDSTDSARGPERICDWCDETSLQRKSLCPVKGCDIRADLAPDPLDPRVAALVSSVKDLRDILDRNLIEREGPNTVTLPDGTTHEGPVVDFLHDLLRVQIRALDAALAAFDKGGNADG
jgi:hypothetical protein